MILAPAQRDVSLYRAFMPRWAAEPLSGAGAALAGGRFNRIAQPALYLSFELTTAVSEYQQTSAFAPPLTLVTYRASLPPLVDLRRLHEGCWDPLWQDWSCDWRQLSIIARVEPPSWVLADLVRQLGHAGIIFPGCPCPHGARTATRSCGQGDCIEVRSVPFEASAGPDRPAHALHLVLLALCWRCLADAQRVGYMV